MEMQMVCCQRQQLSCLSTFPGANQAISHTEASSNLMLICVDSLSKGMKPVSLLVQVQGENPQRTNEGVISNLANSFNSSK